ncbi:hypothetical protein AJ78_07748 [Emergomyces pasteurianus Ep9510]|uniref:dipeptidyl-peptidase IV n=1 Tax=Emergomyces pasteurianus Ep9510 TaxID=1447872 RepID=A0A1J9P5S9_9EURO|nr:hypothetical protein AJ78_07748 [Emergomyces pasteurianus Ep9510]
MKTLVLLLLAGISQAISSPRKPKSPTGGGQKLLTFKEATGVRRVISPETISVGWINGDVDGLHVKLDENSSLVITNIETEETVKVLVPAGEVPEGAFEYFVKPDLSAVLWATNHTKRYRHSYLADYFIQDVETHELTPLDEHQQGDVQYAVWSPVGNTVAYARGNNIYIWNGRSSAQATWDGGPDIFNGVPDWVYEEEIFEDRYAMWFSPDGQYLAFLRFDETDVPTIKIPFYMDEEFEPAINPREESIRYPRVSQPNPKVQFHLLYVRSRKDYVVATDTFFPPDELIIAEVAWVTENHKNVLFRAFNRVQDQEKIVLVDAYYTTGSVVHERDGTDGWLENTKAITYIGKAKNDKTEEGKTYYVDISDMSGWAHVYMFPVEGGHPIQLTSGNWEVTDIVSVDKERELIYFLSTKRHRTERHLYSVSYSTLETKALVDDEVSAYWSASFSSKGRYYILTYGGPDVPYQELYSIESTKPIRVIIENEKTVQALKEYNLPLITYYDIQVEYGIWLSVMQRFPANFDDNKKYPVLFIPYGGPGSQRVTKAFKPLNWQTYISSDPELEYITFTVDGRGTGFNGRKFRSAVSKQLGKIEAMDQIAVGKFVSRLQYVDEHRIGIWGRSYGGYLAAKVIEANTSVFSFGMMTAGVSDWRLYDSMYTERYMKTLDENEHGYETSAVSIPDGFENAPGGFLVQHGTADDNVHFQHAAVLAETLMAEGVGPQELAMQWFTDSDHNIGDYSNSKFLYKQLSAMLYKQKLRDVTAPPEKHQWSRRGPKDLSSA